MISIENYNQIGNNLQRLHEVFYRLWKIGIPKFSKEIDSCCIAFNDKGSFVEFLFNEDFWNQLDNYERAFIVAHECLHVIYNHGERGIREDNKDYLKLINIAQDIVINEVLINHFFLYKTEIIAEGCFLETLTNLGLKPLKNKSFEYYYSLLQSNKDKLSNLPDIDHSHLLLNLRIKNGLSANDQILKKALGISKEKLDKIKQDIKNTSNNGSDDSSAQNILDVINIPCAYNLKWQNLFGKIIKDKRGKFYSEYNKNDWTRENKRYSLMKNKILIPNDKKEMPKDKIEMWFFQDCSGSCVSLKDKFISVARNIPTKIFDVKYHTFDTSVMKIDIHNEQITGGGGTDFQCIENYILRETTEKGLKYPELVFCITDGCSSSKVKPFKEHNWFWLLSQDNKTSFSERCHSVLLED